MNAQLEIIYEDEKLVALNKPYGVNFDWALSAQGGRPELLQVHRLDKDTSGMILFAKNSSAQEYLKKLFQNREINKTYKALVVGNIKENSGMIEEFVTSLIAELRKDPIKNYQMLKNILERWTLINQFNVNKRLQLEAALIE